MPDWLPGVHTTPNVQTGPDIYEIECDAMDPEKKIDAYMKSVADWTDRVVLDIGAGTGYFLSRFHDTAKHVIAVEPHDASRLLAMARVHRMNLTHTSVMTGSAEQLFLPDNSIDIAQAQFAYFWGPGCDPGLSEVARIIRPNGTFFIIDNDLRNGTFASWLAQSSHDARDNADTTETFWAEQGFTQQRIMSTWRFKTRSDLEAVLRLEFPSDLAEEILHEHQSLSIDYGYCVYHKTY